MDYIFIKLEENHFYLFPSYLVYVDPITFRTKKKFFWLLEIFEDLAIVDIENVISNKNLQKILIELKNIANLNIEIDAIPQRIKNKIINLVNQFWKSLIDIYVDIVCRGKRKYKNLNKFMRYVFELFPSKFSEFFNRFMKRNENLRKEEFLIKFNQIFDAIPPNTAIELEAIRQIRAFYPTIEFKDISLFLFRNVWKENFDISTIQNREIKNIPGFNNMIKFVRKALGYNPLIDIFKVEKFIPSISYFRSYKEFINFLHVSFHSQEWQIEDSNRTILYRTILTLDGLSFSKQIRKLFLDESKYIRRFAVMNKTSIINNF
ncbi:MAG: hypothetical protein ACTSO2_20375 [Promethearchaeota archaeon]